MKRTSLLLVLLLSFFSSCKKKLDDSPQPSGPVNGYRIKTWTYYDSTGTVFKGRASYSYDDKHRCIGIASTDANGFVETETFQYDDNDLITFYSYAGPDDSSAYRFSYTSDKLVAFTQIYRALPAVTVYKNVQSVYDSNRNMIYQTIVLAGSLHGDSISYNNYSNSRPADSETNRWNGTAYQVYQKFKYTYDSRMNRIKKEGTMPGNQTVYSDVFNYTFQVLEHQALFDNLVGPQNVVYKESGDDMNAYSANTDKDMLVQNTESYPCGLESEDTYSIEQTNDVGLPTKYREIYSGYNCGAINYHQNYSSTFEYETF